MSSWTPSIVCQRVKVRGFLGSKDIIDAGKRPRVTLRVLSLKLTPRRVFCDLEPVGRRLAQWGWQQ